MNILDIPKIVLIVVAGLFIPALSSHAQALEDQLVFSETLDVIPIEDRSRRKWGNAHIADLDRDGRLDLVFTEHARHAQIYWNNGETFSEPVVLIRGDTHGMASGDFDRDGRMDLMIVPGGGGGNKPSSPIAFHINHDRSIERGEPFQGFMNTRGRAGKLVDVDNDGVLDFMTTAFEGKARGSDINFLYMNTGDEQRFELVGALPRAKRMGPRLLVTDFNNDGDADLLFYGGADMVLAQGGEGHTFTDVTAEVLPGVNTINNASSVCEIDFDNDGDFDLFVTRARHPFGKLTYHDDHSNCFAFFYRNQEIDFEDLTIDGDFIFTNLQMAYPHFDVFAGAEKRLLVFDEYPDQHGNKNFVLKPSEAEGWPHDRPDPGLYIGHLGSSVWRLGGKTQSPTAGVVHNVVSTPKASELKPMPAYLLENRDGVFVDVSAQYGIEISEQTTGSAAGDFNNDGWTDLFVILHGNSAQPTEQVLYLNQGGTSFLRASGHNIVSRELGSTGGGGEAWDYDQDGDLDIIFNNERGRWHLFTNELVMTTGTNHLTVRVGASPLHKASAKGAVLTLYAGGRTYRRVVGASSASYDHSSNNFLHVGLGELDEIDEAVVRWTNGETAAVSVDRVNQLIEVGVFD